MNGASASCSTLPPAPAGFCSDSLPLALLTEKEVAGLARLSTAMLQKLRREGGGPAFVRIGSAVRYPTAAVSTWIDSLRAAA